MNYYNIDNMSDEQIRLREAQIRGDVTQSVGREETVEEKHNREMQQTAEAHRQLDREQQARYGIPRDIPTPKYQTIDNMSDEQIRLREAQIRGSVTQSVGRELTPEERREKEFQETLNAHRQLDAEQQARYGIPRDIPMPKYQTIDNMSDDSLRIIQAMVQEKKENDKPMNETIDNIIQNGLPKNEEDLKALIGKYSERRDFVKTLLEKSKMKLETSIKDWQNFESKEVNDQINKAVYEYLAIISTLNDLKCNLQSPKFAQYDPYYVDLKLSKLSDIMHKRRVSGCNIDIPIPSQYDITNNNSKLDAVRSIYFVEKEIEGQIIDWGRYATPVENKEAVSNFESARQEQMQEDEKMRIAQIQAAQNISNTQNKGFSK